MGVLSQNDPTFAENCSGVTEPPAGCPPEALCTPYATKLADCIEVSCGASFTPYKKGFDELVALDCVQGEQCPKETDVRALLRPEFTCDVPPLSTFATDIPAIKQLCENADELDATKVADRCTELLACPGVDAFFVDVDACMVFVAGAEKAKDLLECLGEADGCGPMGACFGGP